MTAPVLSRPIRIEIELSDLCGQCHTPLSIHGCWAPTAVIHQGAAYPVGNPDCARLLHCRLHHLCHECLTPTSVGCRHSRALARELANVPTIYIGGTS